MIMMVVYTGRSEGMESQSLRYIQVVRANLMNNGLLHPFWQMLDIL